MNEELFFLSGSTDGVNTEGVVSLYSDIFYSPVSSFRIPKGLKAKVWFKSVSGGAVKFVLQYTRDVTQASPTWQDVSAVVLAEDGTISIEKRRPIILRSFTGKEAFRVYWSQTTAAKSYVELGVEVG